MSEHKKRGGLREGAGRKPLNDVPLSAVISARVTQDEAKRFKQLGGSAWLREQLMSGKIKIVLNS